MPFKPADLSSRKSELTNICPRNDANGWAITATPPAARINLTASTGVGAKWPT